MYLVVASRKRFPEDHPVTIAKSSILVSARNIAFPYIRPLRYREKAPLVKIFSLVDLDDSEVTRRAQMTNFLMELVFLNT